MGAAEADGFPGVPVRDQQTRDDDYWRDGVRNVWVVATSVLSDIAIHWPSLQSVVMIRRTRTLADGTVQRWTHFHVSKLPPPVQNLPGVIREHSRVDSGRHWVLDVQMREDDCTICSQHNATNFATNLALVRQMTLMLLKRDTTTGRGVHGRRKKGASDGEYLFHLITRGTTEIE